MTRLFATLALPFLILPLLVLAGCTSAPSVSISQDVCMCSYPEACTEDGWVRCSMRGKSVDCFPNLRPCQCPPGHVNDLTPITICP